MRLRMCNLPTKRMHNLGRAVVARPDPATGFSATVSSTTAIDLAWTSPDPLPTRWVLLRDGKALTPPAPDAESSSDTGLTAGTLYAYTLYPVDSINQAGAVVTDSAYTKPNAPTLFSATAAGATEIDLAWTGATGAYHHYNLRIDGGSPIVIAHGVATYAGTGLDPDTEYDFDLRAATADDTESAAVTDTESTDAGTIPATPTGFTATAQALPDGLTKIDLTWDAPLIPVDSWTLTDNATNVPDPPSGAEHTYLSNNLDPGTAHVYVLKAVINGVQSLPATDTESTLCDAPGSFVADFNDVVTTTLTWDAVTGAASYEVASDSDGYTVWTALASGGTRPSVGGLTWRVRAKDAQARAGEYSEAAET